MEIDKGNAIYRSNRSAAFFSSGKYEDSLEDAYIAMRLDPKYAKAWSRLGLAAAKVGLAKLAFRKHARILTWGYDAYLVHKGVSSSNRLIDHATNLVNDLTTD